MSKYYEAYDTRYRQVHKKGLTWAVDNNTELIEKVIYKYHLKNEKMLEIGCGEGRDSKYLLNNNYNLLATDVSKEAISYCKSVDLVHKECYKVLDVLSNNSLNEKFGFIYSVACLHMLVLDEDRNNFYQYIYNHLEEGGYCLILTMGDGVKQYESDISKAFDNIKRIHQETKKELTIVSTSCKIVNFDTLDKEVIDNGFNIVEQGITSIENHFNEIMYVIIKKA